MLQISDVYQANRNQCVFSNRAVGVDLCLLAPVTTGTQLAREPEQKKANGAFLFLFFSFFYLLM